MSAFENAKRFFTACEEPGGWAKCQPFVADGATFSAQSEPLVEITTVEGYCDWMAGFEKNVVPGAHYKLHTSAYDETTRSASFFATYYGKHTGEGGPVPPTQKETQSDYVYVLTMDANDKVAKMVKIWNAPWAMKELGWM